MSLIAKFWRKFDLKQASYLAFLLLSFLLPIGTKKVWETVWTFPVGDFVDYNAYFLYLTDICLILMLVLWLADILFQFYQKDDWEGWDLDWRRGLFLVVMGGLVFWGLTSVNWSGAIWLSWYRVGRFILMLGFLGYLVIFINYDWKKWLGGLVAVVLGGFIQVIWGGWQYIFQQDLNLWWLGESQLGPDQSGIAKIEYLGQKIVRAYGSLSHANVFGLYLLFALLALLIVGWLWQINIKDKIFQRVINIDSAWFWLFGWLVAGIMISYSRTIWLAVGWLVVGFVVFIGRYFFGKNMDRSRWWLALLVPAIVMIFNYPYLLNRSDINLEQDVSVNVRETYDQLADRMISANYYRGVGLGAFVSQMSKYYHGTLEWWMYEPVHNTFKLVWAELGVLGFIVYGLLWLGVGLVVWLDGGKWRWWWITVWAVFGWLNFIDHYYWDIVVGQLILIYIWGILLMVPGVIGGIVENKKDNRD